MPVDIVPATVRSRMMSGIKGKNTKPDLVFTGCNAVLFVHGCFWHGHDCHLFRWPKSREEFWRDKIGKNIERDRKQRQALAETGWRIGTVWECALKGKTRLPFDSAVDQCAIWLKSDIKTLEVSGDEARATV